LVGEIPVAAVASPAPPLKKKAVPVVQPVEVKRHAGGGATHGIPSLVGGLEHVFSHNIWDNPNPID